MDYKLLAETIYKRKSVRAYADKPVELLDSADLTEFFDIRPLIENIKVNIKVLKTGEVRNNRSEYCIAFYSERKPLALENIGFIGQQIDLELQSRGIGTCWWGMKKPKKDYKSANGLDCVITMTAGHPKSNKARLYLDGFKRKISADIIIGDAEPDNLTEAVRIAPSAQNLQPWLIEKIGNRCNFYLKNPKSILERLMGYMRHIDIGIAMAHFFVQAKADGLDVSFDFEGEERTEGKFIASLTAREVLYGKENME